MFDRDIYYMKRALELAQKAYAEGEVPIGSLIVSSQGEVLGQGYNMVEQFKSQLEHAELRAMREATLSINDWRLNHSTLYVTLEPCMMCISACALSRIERIVFGARSPLFGYQLDKEGVLELYTRQIKNITEGVLQREAAALLKRFFDKKGENR